MKITDRFPMLTVVVADLVNRVEKYDNYNGRVWYKPSTWRKPTMPTERICIEVERGLRAYGQSSLGVVNILGRVFTDIGYPSGCYPLRDVHSRGEFWEGGFGQERRKLLYELHAHLWTLEFGSLPPTNNQVGEIAA